MLSNNKKPHYDIIELFHEKDLVKTCAPMVRYSKLQFRNLVKNYGCDLVFTPMVLADSFCQSLKARKNEFTTNHIDTPVIVQFAANTTQDFANATQLVSPYCDGVDLNCGCPQRWAKEKNLGCELLKNPQTIYDMIRECRNTINKPFSVSVKIRLKKDIKETLELCKNLEKCGTTFLTVHARTPEKHTGEINIDALNLINNHVSIPVIANGGLNSLSDCYKLQELTGCQGAMIANGILTNPMVFSGKNITTMECVQKWVDICYNSTLTPDLHEELSGKDGGFKKTIPERPYNLTFQCFHHHLVFMLEKILPRKKRRIFNNLKTFRDVLDFIEINFSVVPQLFTPEQYLQSALIDVDYSDREINFNSLRENKENVEEDIKIVKEYDHRDGKYFKSKLKAEEFDGCDWSNIFL